MNADENRIASMQLTSPAFADGDAIPSEHATAHAGGRNISIPLSWSKPPSGTRSLALEMFDLYPGANEWIHWLVIDLPPETRALEAGASPTALPRGARELANTFGHVGYDGPQPPRPTGEHPYRIRVLALDTDSLALSSAPTHREFESTAHAHVLGRGELLGRYRQ